LKRIKTFPQFYITTVIIVEKSLSFVENYGIL